MIGAQHPAPGAGVSDLLHRPSCTYGRSSSRPLPEGHGKTYVQKLYLYVERWWGTCNIDSAITSHRKKKKDFERLTKSSCKHDQLTMAWLLPCLSLRDRLTCRTGLNQDEVGSIAVHNGTLAEEKGRGMSRSHSTMLLHEGLPKKWPEKRRKGTRSTTDGLMKGKILQHWERSTLWRRRWRRRRQRREKEEKNIIYYTRDFPNSGLPIR